MAKFISGDIIDIEKMTGEKELVNYTEMHILRPHTMQLPRHEVRVGDLLDICDPNGGKQETAKVVEYSAHDHTITYRYLTHWERFVLALKELPRRILRAITFRRWRQS